MTTKQIVFTKPCVAELLEVECLPPKENEVTVSLEYSAISAGTEKANFVGDRRILGDDGFAKLILIDTHRERSAALEVKAETELVLHRERDIYGEYRDDEKRKPLPDIVTH